MQGTEIKASLERNKSLVRSGIAGFVVFEAELEELKETITILQSISKRPLIFASDLEQGLGQQVKGGTLFPPARAVAEAGKSDPSLIKRTFDHMASEIKASGINTVFAPVLDIDSNPNNPIIATRSYGADAKTVSGTACELIRIFEAAGLRTCGKHFPGHGDTSLDSHLELPKLKRSIKELHQQELPPFKEGVNAGAAMMMLAHMVVPSIENIPTSVSVKTVELLRDTIGFKGIVITDALDMGALKSIGENKAALLALKAGVDILLHPSDPDKIAAYLKQKLKTHDFTKLNEFRDSLITSPQGRWPEDGNALSYEVSKKSLRIEGNLISIKDHTLIVLSDEEVNANILEKGLGLKATVIKSSDDAASFKKPGGKLTVAVFSSIRAYKGSAGSWMKEFINNLRPEMQIAFGPSVLINPDLPGSKIFAWWPGEPAQKAVSKLIVNDY